MVFKFFISSYFKEALARLCGWAAVTESNLDFTVYQGGLEGHCLALAHNSRWNHRAQEKTL